MSYAGRHDGSSAWTPSAVPFAMFDQDTNGWSAAGGTQGVHLIRYHTATPTGYDRALYSTTRLDNSA